MGGRRGHRARLVIDGELLRRPAPMLVKAGLLRREVRIPNQHPSDLLSEH
jgi:hypothetical protein